MRKWRSGSRKKSASAQSSHKALVDIRQQIPAASSLKGYIRTTFYRLQYARTNAQSRALKGLPTTDAPAPEPPTWLAMHEFDEVVRMPSELEDTPSAKKVLGGAKQVERIVYRLAKGLGSKWFFES